MGMAAALMSLMGLSAPRGRQAFAGVGKSGNLKATKRRGAMAWLWRADGDTMVLPSGARYGVKLNKYGVECFGRLNHPRNKHQRRAAR